MFIKYIMNRMDNSLLKSLLVVPICIAAFVAAISYDPAVYTRLPQNEKIIAITFDDHYEVNVKKYGADKILNILKANGVKSTFFLTGAFLKKKPKLVKRILEDGHEIGNHTWSHTWVPAKKESEKRLVGELLKTKNYFLSHFGNSYTDLWRAPHGLVNKTTIGWAKKNNFRHIGWSHATEDWVSDTTSGDYISSVNMLKQFKNLVDSPAGNGAIILCHLETRRDKGNLAEILQEMINYARMKGFTLVKVTDHYKQGK